MEHTKSVIKSLEIAANKNKDNFSETMVVGTKSILAITEAFRLTERRAEEAEAEVQRLNTTAQPEEGNDGYVKSFYEIANILGISAQPNSPRHVFETVMKPKLQDLVATEQPLSDKPSLKAMMRALDAFYVDESVPEAAMMKAFRILLADVMPAAPGGQDD